MKVILIYLVVMAIGWIFYRFNLPKLALFSFIVLMPFRNILSESDLLFTRVSPDNVAMLVWLLCILVIPGILNKQISHAGKFRSLVYSTMFMFMYLVPYFMRIKGTQVIGESETTIQLYSVIRDILMLIACWFGFRLMEREDFNYTIETGVLVAAAIASITIMFGDQIAVLGINPGGSILGRRSGLLYLNPNSAGAYCAIWLGFCLGLMGKSGHRRSRNNFLVILSFMLFAAVLLTGSRQAMIACLAVILFFVYNNYLRFVKGNRALIIIILLVGFYLLYAVYGLLMSERVSEAIEEQGGTFQTRLYHWSVYWDSLMSNPGYFVYGATRGLDYRYATHNYFLYIVYYAGLWALLLFLWQFGKIQRFFRKHATGLEKRYDTAYALIPLMLTSLVNNFILNISVFLILAMALGLPNVQRKFT